MIHFKDDIVKITVKAKQRAEVKRLMLEAENARPAEEKAMDKIYQTIINSAENGDTLCRVPVYIPLERLKELLPGFVIQLVETDWFHSYPGVGNRYYQVEW